jgi:hypothetical protein
VGCLNDPTLAQITPDFAFLDVNGCVDVTLQGHHLGTNATARIGEAEILDLVPASNDPERPEHAQDVGFDYFGRIPSSSTGSFGWQDVTMTVDGEDLVIEDGFYYRSCPGEVYAEVYFVPYTAGTTPGAPTTTPYTTPYNYYSATPDYSVDPTLDIEIVDGCGLDPTVTTAEFTNIADSTVTSVPLTAICSPATATIDIPDALPAGQYTVELVRGGNRSRLSPYRCGAPTTYTYYQVYYAPPGAFACPFDIEIPGVAP